MPFLAGQNLLALDLATLEEFARPRFVEKSVDETVNNSAALQNDNELVLAVAANAVYRMDAVFRFRTGVTPDIQIGWTFPVGMTMSFTALGIVAPAGTALQEFSLTQTNIMTWEGHASVDRSVTLNGSVRVGATSGQLQVRWAQNAANASDTIMRASSYLSLVRTA